MIKLNLQWLKELIFRDDGVQGILSIKPTRNHHSPFKFIKFNTWDMK
jgi:hypothetical protein